MAENKTEQAGERTRPIAQAVPKILTDGSLVYDVQITDANSVVEILAKDGIHAGECATAIQKAIDRATA